jgi:hypothetical protein
VVQVKQVNPFRSFRVNLLVSEPVDSSKDEAENQTNKPGSSASEEQAGNQQVERHRSISTAIDPFSCTEGQWQSVKGDRGYQIRTSTFHTMYQQNMNQLGC